MNKKEKFIKDIKEILGERTFPQAWWLEWFSHDLWYVKDYLRGYFTATKVEVVDGEEVELDELSYEVGYTKGQRAERRKGKWERDIGCCECSNCGWIITAGDEEINNYCPHCGAYMRGEE